MSYRIVEIILNTDHNGAAHANIRFVGKIDTVGFVTGTMGVCDLTITDSHTGSKVLGVSDVAENSIWQPRVLAQDNDGADLEGLYGPPSVLGAVDVVVTNGGDSRRGRLLLMGEVF